MLDAVYDFECWSHVLSCILGFNHCWRFHEACIHTLCMMLFQKACQGNHVDSALQGRQSQSYQGLSASVILALHPKHRLRNCSLAVQYHPAFHCDSFTDTHARSLLCCVLFFCLFLILPGWQIPHPCLSEWALRVEYFSYSYKPTKMTKLVMSGNYFCPESWMLDASVYFAWALTTGLKHTRLMTSRQRDGLLHDVQLPPCQMQCCSTVGLHSCASAGST